MNKITTACHTIRILAIHKVKLCCYWKNWRINGPFWRLYRNTADGATLRDDFNRTYELKRGCFYLTPPDCNLVADCADSDVRQFFIHFEVDQLSGNLDYRLHELPAGGALEMLYRRILEFSSGTTGRILSAIALASTALAMLPDETLNRLERDPEMSRIAEYIKEHLNMPLTLTGLAGKANLSENQFIRRFTAAIGCPPYRYINNLRYSKGANLLEEGKMTIEEIISCIGINDRGHFSRNFKTIYGMSPAFYRKSFQKQQDN